MTTLANQSASAFQKMSSPELLPAQLAPHTLPQLCDLLLKSPMEPVNETVHKSLTKWENTATPSWSKTKAKSRARRVEIYTHLGLDEEQSALFDCLFPPLYLSISKGWYTHKREKAHDYYTRSYSKYLHDLGGFTDEAIDNLEDLTRDVVSRLADPESATPRQTRGMVVGYVQSGKTTHFNGLIARAADAGYRLIIVLAGTTEILRAQTQLRLDKQLIGLPVIKPESQHDKAYKDLTDFVEHNTSEYKSKRVFKWKRRTTSSKDYGYAGPVEDPDNEGLEDPDLPLHAPENIHSLPAQIVVVKKNPSRIVPLSEELVHFPNLRDISVLIVDDESDWASLNTKKDIAERTATNKAIVELMRILPRAQYVGYTATPYANVFIDPSDEEGLFPKDYIVTLPRPNDYMGALEFHDMEVEDEEKFSNSALAGPKQKNHFRPILSGDEDVELQEAVDAFILSGAIKLWRAKQDQGFNPKHHTMLVHISHLKIDMKDIKVEVFKALEAANPSLLRVKKRLRDLWKLDFEKFLAPKYNSLTWEKLEPLLGESWKKINSPAPFLDPTDDEKPDRPVKDGVVVINSDSVTLNHYIPNFEASTDLWKIFVGGQMLSRGYTLRELTISYFRRDPAAGDAVIQMARWFGYRRDYQDLVRLYTLPELYARFEGLCEVEEDLREDLKKYDSLHEDVSPNDIKPLVKGSEKVGQITAVNKSLFAKMLSNPKESYAEPVAFPANRTQIEKNEMLTKDLVNSSTSEKDWIEVTRSGVKKPKKFEAHWAEIKDSAQVLQFLESFERDTLEEVKSRKQKRWGNLENMMRFLKFLRCDAGKTSIDRWLILSLIPASSTPANKFDLGSMTLPLIEATRRSSTAAVGLNEQRFNSFEDADSREGIAKALCGLPSDWTLAHTPAVTKLMSSRQAILIVCAVKDLSNPKNPESVVFSVQFPNNNEPLDYGLAAF